LEIEPVAADVTLPQKVIRSAWWVTLYTIVTKLISPVITVILARLLAPEDFGLMGMAATAISLVSIIGDAGMGQAMIQRKGQVKQIANVVFYNSMALGIIWFLVNYVAAPFVAGYFRTDQVVLVVRVLGLSFLLSPLISVPRDLLVKELEFKQLLFINLLPMLAQGVVSILSAYLGYGVWALVVGQLSGSLLTAIAIWQVTKWRPRLGYDWQMSRELLGFGSAIVGQNFLAWLMTSSDQAFLGRFQGAVSTGIFRLGNNLALMPYTLATAPLMQVMYPAFCKIQQDRESLRSYYLNVVELISLFSFSVGPLAIFSAPYFMPILGDKWVTAIPIMQLLIIRGVFGSVVCVNPEMYKAIGRPGITTAFYAVRILFSVPIYYFTAQMGLVPLCLGHLGLNCVFAPLNTLVVSRVLRVPLRRIWKSLRLSFLIGGMLCGLGILLSQGAAILGLSGAPILMLALQVVTFASVSFLLLLAFARSKIFKIKLMVMNYIS
jgi:lipopolysaccharide exporter